MDTIRISGLRAWGHTGCFDAEQELGQWFEVDLAIQLDLSRCGDDDKLAHPLNYAEVVERVKGGGNQPIPHDRAAQQPNLRDGTGFCASGGGAQPPCEGGGADRRV